MLQRAAWDYREALALNQRLAAQVHDLTQRVEELTAQVSSLEEAAARHKNPDELARTVLASAQRAAREQREAARHEAERLLKKAAKRAHQLEQESAQDAEDRMSELTRVKEVREEVIAQLRATLAAISRDAGENRATLETEETAVRAAPEQ
jgi:cell division septum initiation protein DivIVA